MMLHDKSLEYAMVGMLAAPFAIEGYIAIGETFVGKGLASATYDGISQLATNGWKPGDLNVSELGASFLIQGGGWGSLFAKNAIGNFGGLTASGKYTSIGSKGYDLSSFGSDLLKTGIGKVTDKAFEGLKNISVANKAQLGRWQNLSYKLKYAEMLNWNKYKLEAKGFFKSGAGSVVGGATSGTATNAVPGNKPE